VVEEVAQVVVGIVGVTAKLPVQQVLLLEIPGVITVEMVAAVAVAVEDTFTAE
jgi:hypothetical protein